LEIEERVKAKNRKPVFKHISEFFEFWCDERGASLNVLTDAGEYYLVSGHVMVMTCRFITFQKVKSTCPNALFAISSFTKIWGAEA